MTGGKVIIWIKRSKVPILNFHDNVSRTEISLYIRSLYESYAVSFQQYFAFRYDEITEVTSKI